MTDTLKWAAQNGDLDQLTELTSGEGFNIDIDIGNRTLLHTAADYGQVKCIEFLITKGANINAKDKHGITPLLNAIFEGHTEAVKVLLEKGASKDGKSPAGESYIECAEKKEIKDLLK